MLEHCPSMGRFGIERLAIFFIGHQWCLIFNIASTSNFSTKEKKEKVANNSLL